MIAYQKLLCEVYSVILLLMCLALWAFSFFMIFLGFPFVEEDRLWHRILSVAIFLIAPALIVAIVVFMLSGICNV